MLARMASLRLLRTATRKCVVVTSRPLARAAVGSATLGAGGLVLVVQGPLTISRCETLANGVACTSGGEDTVKHDIVSPEGGAPFRTITLEEVRSHNTEDSIWVTYAGEVFDVTELVSWHPGGKEALLGAAGLDLAAFWQKYQIHFKSAKAIDRLEGCKIGVLSEADRERAEDPCDAETAGALRENEAFQQVRKLPSHAAMAKRREFRKTMNVCMIIMQMPFWWLVRNSLRLLASLAPSLANWCALRLPVSVPGVAGAERLDPENHPRVAIIGGGIAGCSAAYTLGSSGFDVTLYEPREVLGGNAQRNTFDIGGKQITQDLTVLFWAPELYKNYTALLDRLGVERAAVKATYALKTNKNGYDEWYTPPGTEAEKVLVPSLKDRFPHDFERFDIMVKWIRRINNCFTLDSKPSFYKHSGLWPMFNPLNFIQLKTTCKLAGISDEWYDTVLRPFHGWNFSSIHIDNLPAVSIGALDEVVPLTSTRQHESWGPGTSQEVFQKMTRGVNVKLNTRIERVSEMKSGELLVKDEFGNVEKFERVVLACPAGAAGNVLGGNWFERSLLDGVLYHDDFHRSDWKDWLENPVHTDTRVVPGTQEQQASQMRDISFIVDVDTKNNNAEYTHILGSWSPAAKAAGAHGAPMFVTQSEHPHRPVDPDKIDMRTSAPRAHPDLCMHNLMITQAMKFIQGRRGVYFCSNYVTAGNGHDLSFLSGLSVACAIGAKYPFPENEAAKLDYDRLSGFLGLANSHLPVLSPWHWGLRAAAMAGGTLAAPASSA